MLNNIHTSWLRSVLSKASFPVYLKKDMEFTSNHKMHISYGIIQKEFDLYPNEVKVHDYEDIEEKAKLRFKFAVPKQDTMQYFFQWQRYRKYWWSTITTTPSLFAVNEMKYDSSIVDAEIVAKFKFGDQVVENVSMNTDHNSDNTAELSCCIALEKALCVLLLDGITYQTKDGYLRLHNKIAPYKISFALNFQDMDNLQNLKDLATLMYSKISDMQISSWLPTFSLSLTDQIKENLHMGVTYTAILNEETLKNGIFHLLNSSTMLKEQVHVSDFQNYAALICKK